MKDLKKRILSFITSAAVAAAGLVLPVFPAKASALEDKPIIVTLGDSYSCGEGIVPFFGQDNKFPTETTVNPDWLAHRSKEAWPGKLTLPGVTGTMADHCNIGAADEKDVNWYFAAASGATTDDLTNPQNIDYDYDRSHHGSASIPAQLNILNGLTLTDNDFVTISIGGNDIGFVDIITRMLYESDDDFQALVGEGGEKRTAFYNSIKAKLIAGYQAINNAAGDATIVVVGYPYLVKAGTFKVLNAVDISSEKANALHDAVDWFNDEIEATVNELKDGGMKIQFVDVRSYFNGHEAYTDTDPYIGEVSLTPGEHDIKKNAFLSTASSSIHPNAAGTAIYADTVQKVLDSLTKPEPTEHTVTVIGGTADKNTAVQGETVMITANVPSGQKFAGWSVTGVTLSSIYADPATFVMPDNDVTAVAVFIEDSDIPGSIPGPIRPTYIVPEYTPTNNTAPASSEDSNDNEPTARGKTGWPGIVDEIAGLPGGGSLTVDMNGTSRLPKDAVEALSGKDADLILDMGGGISWTINGRSVTGVSGDIDMGVSFGDSGIPADVYSAFAGDNYGVTISSAHNGEFGFTAELTVSLRRQDAGSFANLFCYDPVKKALEYVSCAKIDDNGNAVLAFTRGADYAVIADDSSPDTREITAAVNGSSVKLSWDAVPGAASYTVYTAKDGKWVKLTATARTSLNVTKLKNNKTYRFLVRAKTGGKLTPVDESYQITVKVCYKPVLNAAEKDGMISLKWSKVNNASEYRVLKYTSGEWKAVTTLSGTSLKISGVKSGKTYRYAVQAYVSGSWTTVGTASTAAVTVK